MAVDEPVEEDGAKPAWRRTRWTLVAVLVLGSAATLMLVRPLVCGQQVSEGKVLDVCTAITMTDPRVVLVFLAVALLLLPDIQELNIGGVFSIKRQVAEAKGAAEKAAGAAKEAEGAAKAATVESRITQRLLSGPGSGVGAGVGPAASASRPLSTARVQRSVSVGDLPGDGAVGGALAGGAELARAEEALMAFQAGFLGLEQLFPAVVEVAGIVGLVPDGAGWRRVIGTGAASVDVDAWFRDNSVHEVTVEALPDALVGAAIVLDEAGVPVCALVAVGAPVTATGAQGRPEQLAASIQPVSRAFRRLLGDLLGEPTAAGI